MTTYYTCAVCIHYSIQTYYHLISLSMHIHTILLSSSSLGLTARGVARNDYCCVELDVCASRMNDCRANCPNLPTLPACLSQEGCPLSLTLVEESGLFDSGASCLPLTRPHLTGVQPLPGLPPRSGIEEPTPGHLAVAEVASSLRGANCSSSSAWPCSACPVPQQQSDLGAGVVSGLWSSGLMTSGLVP